MADREVVIKISAKNLTEAEFKKVRKGLAGIGSSGGGANQKISALSRGFTSFGKAAPGALKIVAAAAAATAGAIVGVTAAVIKLGERGAAIADVKSAFDGLSVSAGETGAVMLGALRAGVKGTVSDFALMKIANTALGAGLLSTSADAKTLAEGARLLAKRTGGDTVQAFNTLTTSMASGRTAQLKQLGLFVDNKKAVEDFAEAQGKSVSSLTDTDRATALQVATMAALRNELESFPAPLADFGELLERGRVGVKNMVDEIAVMISNSPILLEGMRSAGDAISKAFGDDKQGLALGIVNVIEKAALVAIEFGKAGITAADFLLRGFAGVKIMFLGLAAPLTEVGQRLAELVAFTVEVAAKVPGLGNVYGDVAVKARAFADGATAINTGLKQQIVDSLATVAGHGELQEKLQAGKVFLDEFKTGLVNAGLSQQAMNQTTAAGVVHVTAMGTALGVANFQMQALTPVMVDWQGNLVETGEAAGAWSILVRQSFLESTTAGEGFGVATVGVGDLVMGSNRRVEESMRRLGITSREESKKTEQQIAKDLKNIVKKYGEYSKEAIEAQKVLDEFRVQSTADTAEAQLSTHEAFTTGASTVFNSLGGRFQKFAAAEGAISALLAAVKTMATTPWPANIPMAAAALGAGMAVVAKIKSASTGFREGTDRLDFQDFGSSSLQTLHGPEAVIPQGSGHMLAREIAGELGRNNRSDAAGAQQIEELRAMRSSIEGLPRAIQRAVRDGMVLA